MSLKDQNHAFWVGRIAGNVARDPDVVMYHPSDVAGTYEHYFMVKVWTGTEYGWYKVTVEPTDPPPEAQRNGR